jgi:hypothetical protein
VAGFLDTQSTTNQTEAIYIAYFTRAGDGPGVVFWTDAFANFTAGGATIDQAATLIAQSFAVQPEATATYAFLAAPPNPLNPSNPTQIAGVDAFIEQVYQNLFNRSADSAGLQFWQNAILTGQVTVGAAVYTIANGATGADQTVLANKIAAAEFFTTDTFAANLGTTTPLSPTFLAEAHASVTNVTSPTTLAESQSATAAYVASPGGTFVLTVNEDTVGTQFSNVLGTAGGAGETLTNGDVITGNAAQTVTIQVTDSTTAPGVATINGSGLVNLVVSASNNLATVTNGGFNALQWGTTTPIGTVEITPTAQNTVTGISNASPTGIGVIEINAANNNASLYVGFNSSGIGNFALDSGVSNANPGTLDATGTTIFANGLANALTAANIAFTGTNWDVINLGTNAHTVTMTGTGTDFVTFGALPTSGGLNVDFHTMANAQNLTFQVGALNTNTGNAVTIEGGGLAANDTVTALGMTTSEALVMSGVDNLVTDFRGGNMNFNGLNVVGLQTLTVNAAPGAVPQGFEDTFSNMNVDPMVVNINGPVGLVNFDAIGPAGSVTVNFGGNAAAVTFDGLAVLDVASLTVNFNEGFLAGSAVGEIDADVINTTTLVVTDGAKSTNDTVALGGTAALTQLTIQATANSAVMHVTDAVFPVVINAPHASVNVTAVATDSTAWLSGVTDLSNLSNDAFHVVTVFAEGDGSLALIGPHVHAGPFDLSTLGGIGEIDITAGGANSVAHLTHFATGGSVGNINVTARGNGSSATISTGTLALGSINSINVSAQGTDSTAIIGTIDPLSIQNVTITASGVGSVAVIEHLVGITGTVANINITASGNSSFAGLVSPLNAIAAGDISSINVTASGDDSAAVLFFPTLTFSDINQINVTASGDGAFALGEVVALNSIQAASVTASGVGSLAVEILDPLFIGTVTVTTSALGDGDPIIHPPSLSFPPIPPFPPLLVDGIVGLFSGGSASESTAVLSYGDAQVTNGGVINASGAGFFDMEQTLHGGFQVNAANTGGFTFLVGFSVFTDDHTLTTTINSASNFNFIQAGVENMVISTGSANATSTPGNLNGNTFDMGTAWGIGHDPFGNFGAGVTSAVQAVGISGGVANEIIKTGFTSGGTNAFQFQGQLEIGHGLGAGVAMVSSFSTTGNFLADTSAGSYSALVADALQDAINSKGVGGHLAYVAASFGGNTWVAVAPEGMATVTGGGPAPTAFTGTGHVMQVVELVGVSSIVAHDISA